MNSKTGSPRPVSPSEASSHPTDDPSPRYSKPSESMRNLFNSKSDLAPRNDDISEHRRPTRELIGSSSSSSNKPPLRGTTPQNPLLNPSPLRSPHSKPNSSQRSQLLNRPQSNSKTSIPLSPQQNDILNALLQQTSSSSLSGTPGKVVNDLNENGGISNTKGIDMNNNEDILDGLLKRRGINSSQRSSRSADSNR